MKKKLLLVFAVALLVPCMLILTACGKDEIGKVSVNTDGTYQKSTKEEVVQYIQTLDEQSLTFEGYKMSFIVTMTYDEQTFETEINAIAKINSEGKLEMEMEAKALDEKYKMYLKDDNLYMDMKDYKYYTPYEQNNEFDYLTDFPTVQSIMEKLQGMLDSQLHNIKSSTEGKTTKYEINYTSSYESATTSNTMWMVFENGVISGIRQRTETSSLQARLILDVHVAGYSGKIDFPSFSDYLPMPTI